MASAKAEIMNDINLYNCNQCNKEMEWDRGYIDFTHGKQKLCRSCLVDKIESDNGKTKVSEHLKSLGLDGND